jgi:hypothetical protein
VWREEKAKRDAAWERSDHLLTLLIEQQDRWFLALFRALRQHKRVGIPGPVQIERPGVEKKPRGRVVKSLSEAAAWFAKHK